MTVSKVKTVYQDYVEAGKEHRIEYSLKDNVKTNFIYRLQVGGDQTTGKLISVQ
jgi:hypothetical protein